MKKQKKLIVGNWKMNPTDLEDAKEIFSTIKRVSSKIKNSEIVVCPPFVYTSLFYKKTKSKNFYLGSQDAHEEVSGPYTGEVSHSMLYQFGVRFVIVGHSERRKIGESDDVVNRKIKSVVNSGMMAILCVGEKERDHNGDYLDFIKNQIVSGLKDINKKLLSSVIIAYEPIWAIGAKESVGGRELHEMSIFIKKVLKENYDVYSDDIKIIYGGSVDRVNADMLVREGNVSGLLIGRQSVNSKDFSEIIKLVDSI